MPQNLEGKRLKGKVFLKLNQAAFIVPKIDLLKYAQTQNTPFLQRLG